MRELLTALHPSGFRDLRALKPGATPVTALHSCDDFDGVVDFIARHAADRNIYVGVAARDGQGRDAGHCTALHALFVDLDFKDSSEASCFERLSTFPLSPSAVVHSGGGLQPYWFLEQPYDLRVGCEAAGAMLRSLSHALTADMAAAEPARILRMPGTTNHKYPRPVAVAAFDGTRYPITAFASALPAVHEARDRDRTPVRHNLSRERRIAMAREWLSQQPPAIQGEGGDRQTFVICCGVVHDHDLDADAAFAVLRPWNQTCVPPWTESDLKKKIRGAARSAKGRRGSKLLRRPAFLSVHRILGVPRAWIRGY